MENIYFQNSELDSTINVFQFNLNWYPAFSYSLLPDGYIYDSIPELWKVMLHKVEPESKGIPAAKNIFVSNLQATNSKKVFEVTGLQQSTLSNFNFTNSMISAASIGDLEYIDEWKFNNFNISLSAKPPVQKASSLAEQERLN